MKNNRYIKNCIKCGRIINKNATFCPECLTIQPKNKNIIFIIAGVVLFYFIIGVTFLPNDNNSNQNVADTKLSEKTNDEKNLDSLTNLENEEKTLSESPKEDAKEKDNKTNNSTKKITSTSKPNNNSSSNKKNSSNSNETVNNNSSNINDPSSSTNNEETNNDSSSKNEEDSSKNNNTSSSYNGSPADTNANESTPLPLKAICKDGAISYQDDPYKPNYRGMCSGHGGIKTRLGRVK